VRLLGSLLEGPEDFFFKPDPEQPVFRSLKAESGRLISKLPPAGRESYELQFGSQARQMLQEAAAAGDLVRIADVSRRFFYTQAGGEATFLLGRHYLDQNRPLAAVMCFERLLAVPEARERLEPALSLSLATCWVRAGKSDKAKEVLAEFRKKFPDGEVFVGGKRVPLFAGEEQSLAWMQEHLGKQPIVAPHETDQWVMFRGNEARNAPSSGGQPLLSVRWRQRTGDDAAIEEFVNKLRHDYLSQDIVALPSMHPLAVSDVVLMRTAFSLQAVDFETGKLVWKYAAGDESLEQFLRAMSAQQSGQNTQALLAALDGRMWEDTTYGTLSSDSQQVYYIEDLGLTGMNANMVMTVLPSGQRRYSANSRNTNRLAARELRTQGKLKWVVGGVSGEDEPKLAGAFFLGPPLPLMGQLYALAEVKGQEIRLVALAPETGALLWSQQLAVVDPPVSQDGSRRNSGATPSYADGVLVCPTAAGAIVGLDLSTRSLLWGYQYPRIATAANPRFQMRATMYAGGGGEQRAADHWSDGSITIVDGRVLVTPPETDEIYCLNLFDGHELWKQSRGANLYVACVHEGKAIVVGHKSISALNLADGTKAWPDLALPDKSMPSGRGFYSGGDYYLPLTSAEVARIDLKKGEIAERARSRSGNVPGNLICYRDSIISQSADGLDAYYQINVLKERIEKTLAEKPDDPEALAALGEIKLDEKALPEAIALFRRSHAAKPTAATRIQLIESLLTGLRSDFPAFRGGLAELETLIEQPRHRMEYLRLKAAGLQQAGESWPAFETYVELIDEHAPWDLDEVDQNLSVRRDRWLREQLSRLRAAADQSVQLRIDELVGRRLKDASNGKSVEELRSFVNLFGTLPAAATARELLAQRLSSDDLLEQNLLLEDRLQTSSGTAAAGAATAQLAAALRSGGRGDLAAVYYRDLNTRFADVVCVDGLTGRQLVEELPQADTARALLKPVDWREGRVDAKEERNVGRGGGRMMRPRPANLEVVGNRSSLYRDVNFSILFDAQQYLVADDGYGVNRFRVLLSEQGMRRATQVRSAYSMPSISYTSLHGGLVVLSMGTQLMAIDTLRSGDSLANRVLWTEDLSDQIGGMSAMQSVVPRAIGLKWGGTRFVPEDTFGRRYGTIGPVTTDGVYYQRLHDLYCVDPLSGKTIWMRKNLPLGLDLFGDGEFLFAAHPAKNGETLVLRAATGEILNKRRIAPIEDRMVTIGRKILTWQSVDGQQMLEMRDLAADQANWSFRFAAGSKAALVGQEVVGVLQPDGAFSLVRLSDGHRLSAEKLETDKGLLGIHLLPWERGYILATHAAVAASSNQSVQPYPNSPDCPLITGRLYAFDRESGKSTWPAPIKISQQGLLLSQPRDLPVLALLRQVTKPGPINSRDPRLSVLCIDKRTGKVVYDREDLPGTTVSACSFAADPAEQRVTITLPNQEIALTYTGEAGEAKPAEPSPVDRQKAADAILEAIGLKGARKPGPREEAGTPEKPSVAPPDKK
jgi:outer membrane protein assembly factor BamB